MHLERDEKARCLSIADVASNSWLLWVGSLLMVSSNGVRELVRNQGNIKLTFKTHPLYGRMQERCSQTPNTLDRDGCLDQDLRLSRSMQNVRRTQRMVAQSRSTLLLVATGFGVPNEVYLPAFFRSASVSGADLTWLGERPVCSLPRTVRLVLLDWAGFVRRIREKIPAVTAALTNSRKVFDFRPLLSFLFPELMAGYTHWAHVDSDQLVGNLRGLIERLGPIDISTR